MLDHPHILSPPQDIKKQGNTLFVNGLGLFVPWKICLQVDLNNQIPEDFRLLTKQPLPLSPTLNIKGFLCILSHKSVLVLAIHRLVRTQTDSQPADQL